MKKNLIKVTLVAAFALIAGYNVYSSQKAERMSDLALANVEALANSNESSERFLDVTKRTTTVVDENGNQYTIIVLDCKQPNSGGNLCA